MGEAMVYLIPTFLDEDGLDAIPAYVVSAIKDCQVFFVENERTARRYFKQVWREMVIDDYEWHVIHKAESEVQSILREKLSQGLRVGIVSEAGCPGIADPGQALIAVAQEMNVRVKPLVGPNSILLALMASGMNGQQFQFNGYLPIDGGERIRKIRELEAESKKKRCTQIFIETPYRNNQLLEALVKNCQPATRLCIACNLTGKNEWVRTQTISTWAKSTPDIHKRPAIFLLYGAD